MKNIKMKALKIFSLVFCGLFVLVVSAFAEVSIDIFSPFGQTLILDKPSDGYTVIEQATVQVTSSSSGADVFHTFDQPLINGSGIVLSSNALEIKAVGSANAYRNWDSGELRIFNSGSPFTNRSVTMNYRLNPQHINGGGTFNGRIQVSIIADSGEIRYAFLDVRLEAGEALQVSLSDAGESASGFSNVAQPIQVDMTDADINLSSYGGSDDIRIDYTNNTGGQIQIYQSILEIPFHPRWGELPSNVVSGLSSRLIESSFSTSGYAVADFSINAQNAANLMAGDYQGRVQFDVTTGGETETVYADITVEVPEIFEISMENNTNRVDLGRDLNAAKPVGEGVIRAIVTNNTGDPYRLNQHIITSLVNSRGETIPRERIKVKVRKVGSGGSSGNYQTVDVGVSQDIYHSDGTNMTEEFEIEYKIDLSGGVFRSGEYSASYGVTAIKN